MCGARCVQRRPYPSPSARTARASVPGISSAGTCALALRVAIATVLTVSGAALRVVGVVAFLAGQFSHDAPDAARQDVSHAVSQPASDALFVAVAVAAGQRLFQLF